MTPYNEHKAAAAETPAEHRIVRHSPNGVDIVEECSCGARFLHNPCIGYPVSLDWHPPQQGSRKWRSGVLRKPQLRPH